MILLVVSLSGCGRSRDDAPAPPRAIMPAAELPSSTSGTTSAPATAPACSLSALPLRRPAAPRVVAIGDVHGDLAATRAALRAAGAIDDADRWIGGALVVVQTGDVLDRGDDEQAIIDLILRLEGEASAAGGALVMLLGNHELMNAAGDFRYVTPAGFTDFADAPGLDLSRAAAAPEPMKARFAALGPGGVYAKKLAQHAVVAIVGDAVYSHAGVVAEWAPQLDALNRAARCWLDGQGEPPEPLTRESSPVWTRAYGRGNVDCAQLTAALTALGARRMIVGHTPQQAGITSACDGALWRIDVGLGRRYGGPIQVLELTAGGPKVLHGTRPSGS